MSLTCRVRSRMLFAPGRRLRWRETEWTATAWKTSSWFSPEPVGIALMKQRARMSPKQVKARQRHLPDLYDIVVESSTSLHQDSRQSATSNRPLEPDSSIPFKELASMVLGHAGRHITSGNGLGAVGRRAGQPENLSSKAGTDEGERPLKGSDASIGLTQPKVRYHCGGAASARGFACDSMVHLHD